MLSRMIVALVVLTLVGCGGSGFQVAPVSGTVTLDGAPLPDASVVFQPIAVGTSDAGQGSVGKTDAAGKFTLMTIDKQPGAVVANHRVSISTYQADETAEGMVITAEEKVPAKFNEETELVFEVPAGGTDAADFDLTSEGGEPQSAG